MPDLKELVAEFFGIVERMDSENAYVSLRDAFTNDKYFATMTRDKFDSISISEGDEFRTSIYKINNKDPVLEVIKIAPREITPEMYKKIDEELERVYGGEESF